MKNRTSGASACQVLTMLKRPMQKLAKCAAIKIKDNSCSWKEKQSELTYEKVDLHQMATMYVSIIWQAIFF